MSDTKTSQPSTAPVAKTFADFGVDPAICDSLAAVGILSPFPIQEMTLPLALTGADIIGQARTGTGKTLGFGLPLLQRIDTDGALQALVIVPTRELCLQVSEDLAQAGKGRGVDVLAVYGGKAIQPQIDAIADGAHLVVGTPGRLLDLSRRGVLDLSQVAGLVLDEADEMLDLGFLPDVEALIEQCRDDRQTLLFSATMPAAIVGLARRYMTKPTFMRADVEEINIAPKTKQYFFSCHRMDKPAVVARILQTPDRGLCVIFCRTKRMADILAEELRDRDVAAQAIHSDLRQDAREKVMQKFRDGKVTVLCATEVAARGLDIDDVTHVVNYDCPDDEKMYLHRIGRTGRAGADGVAITFAVWNELPRLEMIRRELDITDEIHEVFSTSPLLDELFDLPAREERKKVPSPPQGRSSKSRKGRGDTGEDAKGDKGGRSKGKGRGGRSADTTSDAEATSDAAATTDTTTARTTRDSDTAEDGVVRTRRRTRTRSGGGDTGRRTATTSDDTAGDAGSARSSGTSREDGAEEQGGERRRRRSRGGRGGQEQSGSETSTARTATADQDDEQPSTRTRTRTRPDRGGRDASSDAEGRDRGRSEERSGGRSEERSGGRSEERSGGRSEEKSRTRSTEKSGGRSEEKSGGRSEEKSGGRSEEKSGGRSEEKSGGRSEERSGGRSRSGGGRSGGGRGKGGSGGRSSGSGGRSSGNGGRNSGRGSSGRSSNGNGGRSQKSPSVDHTEARGVGQPRLSRKLEVEHLP